MEGSFQFDRMHSVLLSAVRCGNLNIVYRR